MTTELTLLGWSVIGLAVAVTVANRAGGLSALGADIWLVARSSTCPST